MSKIIPSHLLGLFFFFCLLLHWWCALALFWCGLIFDTVYTIFFCIIWIWNSVIGNISYPVNVGLHWTNTLHSFSLTFEHDSNLVEWIFFSFILWVWNCQKTQFQSVNERQKDGIMRYEISQAKFSSQHGAVKYFTFLFSKKNLDHCARIPLTKVYIIFGLITLNRSFVVCFLCNMKALRGSKNVRRIRFHVASVNKGLKFNFHSKIFSWPLWLILNQTEYKNLAAHYRGTYPTFSYSYIESKPEKRIKKGRTQKTDFFWILRSSSKISWILCFCFFSQSVSL